MSFILEIITPQRQAFSDAVQSVSVPTINGTIEVLSHHVPLFSALTEGEVKIHTGNKEFFLGIGGGFMEVTHSRVSVLVTRAVHADELNESEIKKAHQAAKDIVAKKATGEELAQAQSLLRRSVLELKLLRRRKTGMPVISH